MAWIRVDTNLEMDRKFRKLSGIGRAVIQFAWRLAKDKEGRIDGEDWDEQYFAEMVKFDDAEAEVAAQMLLIEQHGFVEKFENGNDYFITNWDKFQKPKDRTNAERQKRYREKNRDTVNRNSLQYQKDNPSKVKAHSDVRTAVNKGALIAGPCCECGDRGDTVAHHDNYLMTLSVRWMCKSCHSVFHKNNEPVTDSNGVTVRYVTRNGVHDSTVRDSTGHDVTVRDKSTDTVPASVQNTKKPKKKKTETKGADTWAGYAFGYKMRYGVEPVRNARTNAQCCQLVDKLGAEEAPKVAAFYTSSHNSYYIAKGHSLGVLVADAEKMRTEWHTGRSVTQAGAREADRLQNVGDGWQKAIEKFGDK